MDDGSDTGSGMQDAVAALFKSLRGRQILNEAGVLQKSGQKVAILRPRRISESECDMVFGPLPWQTSSL